MHRINFKTFLFITGVVGLVGCGNVQEEVSKDEYTVLKYTQNKLVKNIGGMVYKTANNICYYRELYGSAVSFSQVDCRDFGMGDKEEEKSKENIDSVLLEYIYNNCVVEDEYGDLPRTEGDSWNKTLSEKKLQCQLPENIDKDINERKLYETLKNKYEVR